MQTKSRLFSAKTLHLKISAAVIMVIGIVYGLYPDNVLPKVFDFNANTPDQKNILRAIMGLYFAMAFTWILGIIKKRLWITATITNIAFMGGLAAGRLISLLIDGRPSFYLSIGLVPEIILAGWGILNLKRYRDLSNK